MPDITPKLEPANVHIDPGLSDFQRQQNAQIVCRDTSAPQQKP